MIYLFSILLLPFCALVCGAFFYLYLRETKKNDHLLNLVLQSNGKRPVPAMRIQGKVKPEAEKERRDYAYNIVGDRKDSPIDVLRAAAIERDNRESGVYADTEGQRPIN